MNLNGIGNAYGGVRLPQQHPQTRVDQERPAQTQAPAPASTPPARGIAPAQDAGQSVPVEPPAGTDPELWSVLTREERAYFAKSGAKGPLTYGHLLNSGRADVPVNRGGRLDVKA